MIRAYLIRIIIDLYKIINYTLKCPFLIPGGSQLNLRVKPVIGAKITEVIHPGQAHFAMIEKEAIMNLDKLMRENMQAARLVMSLVRLMEPGTGGVVVADRETMAELIDVSVPTIQRALKVLVDGNWVRRVKIGGAHALAINEEFAWVGKQDHKQQAVFRATVIASRAQQSETDLRPGMPKKFPVAHPGESPLPIGKDPEPPSQGLIEGTEPVAVTGDSD